MPVALYDERMAELAPCLRLLTDNLRAVTSGTGSVPLRTIDVIGGLTHRVSVAAAKLLAEFAPDAATGFSNATEALKRRPGGPQTVPALQAALVAAQEAGNGYVAATLAMLNGARMGWAKTEVTDPETGVKSARLVLPNAVPAAAADPWRIHKDVLAFRDALVAAGG